MEETTSMEGMDIHQVSGYDFESEVHGIICAVSRLKNNHYNKMDLENFVRLHNVMTDIKKQYDYIRGEE